MFDSFPRPLIFGHRGACAQAPENTLESFQLAVDAGVDVLELDVHLSRDGELVVIHDATVDRTTNGHGAVSSLTLCELDRLDAGYGYARDGEHPWRGRRVKVSRLADVLEAFPSVGFNVELKQHRPSLVPPALTLLDRIDPTRLVIAAEDHRTMAEIERFGPRAPLGMSREQVVRALLGAYSSGVPTRFRGRALQIPPTHHGLPVASALLIRRAHAAGLEVHLWTLDEPDEARKWVALGADGIMSDAPARIVAALRP